MKIEIRFTGSGGQGLVLASRVLAKAALIESRNVLQSQVYGAEARGGATKSEVIISNKEIFFPEVLIPDILVIMTNEAYKKYSKSLKENGIMVLDSFTVSSYNLDKEFKNYVIPFTEIAERQFHSKILANMLMLGFVSKIAGLVKIESVIEALSTIFSGRTLEINIEAARLGNSLENIPT